MRRIDSRRKDELRDVTIAAPALDWAEGSCLIEFGKTRILAAASLEDRLPKWLDGQDKGWITAEYAMLPRSGRTRSPRDRGQNPRSLEIQRIIGRSLRAVTDLRKMPGLCVTIDCDTLQADGGTRTASVTGAYVALSMAFAKARALGLLRADPLLDSVAAVSVGVCGGELLLDLCYEEDSAAEVDANVVVTGKGRLVEVQATAEKAPFDKRVLDEMIALARKGARKLALLQKRALAGAL